MALTNGFLQCYFSESPRGPCVKISRDDFVNMARTGQSPQTGLLEIQLKISESSTAAFSRKVEGTNIGPVGPVACWRRAVDGRPT